MPRTKGSPNKITQETKVFLQHILNDERSNIKSALSELYASNKLQYVQAIIKLLPFVTPKHEFTMKVIFKFSLHKSMYQQITSKKHFEKKTHI